MKGRLAAATLSALAFLIPACSGPKGHRLLTFFFDGVPPLETPATATGSATGGGAAVPRQAPGSEHGPYASKLCEACHETGRANSLLMPADQLCGRCHSLALERRYVHGPLLAGGCLVCHDPHRSSNPNLLVAESGAFCLRCHERSSLRETAGHESGGPQCTTCHEAHMSDRPYLLR